MSRAYKKLFGFGPYHKGEQLVFLIQNGGIESFNAARSKNPNWRPDFSGADLRGIDVSLANLQGANLSKASLDGVIVDNLEMSDERARRVLARRGAIVE